jgi:TatD DNase family protein
VVERATAVGVMHGVMVAESMASTGEVIPLAKALGWSATAGVHPHHASEWSVESAAVVRDALGDPAVVAVGETGLDYHYDHAPRDRQRASFEAQLALAADHDKAVVVHARDADADVAAILRSWRGRLPPLVLHSFSSGPDVFQAGLDVGAYFGFSGMVTFRNWTLADCLRACPEDRLLLETDAPFLTPVPHRGTRNEPAYVALVAARVAEVRGAPVAQVAAATTANAVRCFGGRLR